MCPTETDPPLAKRSRDLSKEPIKYLFINAVYSSMKINGGLATVSV